MPTLLRDVGMAHNNDTRCSDRRTAIIRGPGATRCVCRFARTHPTRLKISNGGSAEFAGNQRNVLHPWQLPFDRFRPTPYDELVNQFTDELGRTGSNWDELRRTATNWDELGQGDDGTRGRGKMYACVPDRNQALHSRLSALVPGLWTHGFAAPGCRPKSLPALTCPFARAGISS